MNPRLRRALREHILIKLIAIGIGVVLHIGVRGDTMREIQATVSLSVKGLDEERVLTEALPSELRLTVRGRWSRVQRVLGQRLDAYELSMSDLTDGEVYQFDRLKLQRLLGVDGLQVVDVSPSQLVVRLEPRVTRALPVRVDLVGSPVDDYEYDPSLVQVEPEKVDVTGPKGSVDGLPAVFTNPVSLAGLERDLEADVPLLRPDRPHVQLETKRVMVRLPLRDRLVEDELPSVRILVRNCSARMRCYVTPVHARVRVSGPRRRVRELKEQGTSQMLWVEALELSLEPGVYELEVQRKQFDEIEIEIDPPKVTLEVEAVAFALPPPLPPAPPPEPPLDDEALEEGGSDRPAGEEGEANAPGQTDEGAAPEDEAPSPPPESPKEKP